MSDTTTVEQTVREVIAAVLGITAAELAADPVLAAHQWDSLSSLYTFTELENRLGVGLDLHTFHTARTVEEMVGLVDVAVAPRAA